MKNPNADLIRGCPPWSNTAMAAQIRNVVGLLDAEPVWHYVHSGALCDICGSDHDCSLTGRGLHICRRIGTGLAENGHSQRRSVPHLAEGHSRLYEFLVSFHIWTGGIVHVWRQIGTDPIPTHLRHEQGRIALKIKDRLGVLKREAGSAMDLLEAPLDRERLVEALRGFQADLETLHQLVGEHRGLEAALRPKDES